jgi:hypothetical protein
MALVLEQAHRGIAQQQHDLDNLRARAGTLVAAAALVSTFLGAETLRDDRLPAPALAAAITAVAALVVVIAAAAVILLPYQWRWGIDAWALLRDYVQPENDRPATLDELRRDLAWHMQDDANHNDAQLRRLFLALTVAVIAIGAEVAAWTTALLTR